MLMSLLRGKKSSERGRENPAAHVLDPGQLFKLDQKTLDVAFCQFRTAKRRENDRSLSRCDARTV